MKVTSDKDTALRTPNGVHSMLIKAGVEVTVPKALQDAAIKAGLGDTPKKKGPTKDDQVAATVAAIRDLLAKDDPALLDTDGVPRNTEIKKITGFSPKKAVKEEAMVIVEG